MFDGVPFPAGLLSGPGPREVDALDPINQALLGAWPLDESGGAFVRDISSYNRSAWHSSPLPRSVAQFGRYASYNATGTTVYSGRILSGRDNWSIVAAIKNTTANTPGGKAIYCERAPSGNDILKLDICNAFSNNCADIVIRDTAGTLLFVSGSTTIVNDGKWHTVVATKRGSSVTLYVDGRIEATGTWTGSNTFTNSGTLSTIASDAGDSSGNYVGDVARVRVLGRALGHAEVRRLQADIAAGWPLVARRLLVAVSGVSVSPFTAVSALTLAPIAAATAATASLAGSSAGTLAAPAAATAGANAIAGASVATQAAIAATSRAAAALATITTLTLSGIAGTAAGTVALAGVAAQAFTLSGATLAGSALAARSAVAFSITGVTLALNPYDGPGLPAEWLPQLGGTARLVLPGGGSLLRAPSRASTLTPGAGNVLRGLAEPS